VLQLSERGSRPRFVDRLVVVMGRFLRAHWFDASPHVRHTCPCIHIVQTLARASALLDRSSAPVSRDTLSDLLRSVRLRGAVFYYVSFRGRWAAGAPEAREVAQAVMPGCDHVMEYHMIAKGSGWGAVAGLPPVRLLAGDVVLFPQGDRHVISSAPGLEPHGADPESLFHESNHRLPLPISFQEGIVQAGSLPIDSADAV